MYHVHSSVRCKLLTLLVHLKTQTLNYSHLLKWSHHLATGPATKCWDTKTTTTELLNRSACLHAHMRARTHRCLSSLVVNHVQFGERVSEIVDGGHLCEAETFSNLQRGPLARHQHVFVHELTEHLQRTVWHHNLLRVHLVAEQGGVTGSKCDAGITIKTCGKNPPL